MQHVHSCKLMDFNEARSSGHFQEVHYLKRSPCFLLILQQIIAKKAIFVQHNSRSLFGLEELTEDNNLARKFVFLLAEGRSENYTIVIARAYFSLQM